MSQSNKNQSNKTDIATVFAGIISQAAKSPAQTGVVEKAGRRQAGAGTASVLLLDVSQSMAERVGSKRKIDLLREALTGVLTARGEGVISEEVLLSFSSDTGRLSSLASLPEPYGSTALHLALGAATLYRPRHTLVVSDGQPDDAAAALAAADRLPGQIDVLYVGRDDDAEAMAFMRKLARVGGGRVSVHDMRRTATPAALGTAIRGLLPAPGQSL